MDPTEAVFGFRPRVVRWNCAGGDYSAALIANASTPAITGLTLIVAFRRHTLLPLDDCLYALQATIPHLTRSSLHRLFQRHAVSCLPTAEGTRPRRKFKAYPMGYIHVDLAEVWTQEGQLYLFVAIDPVSKFAYAELQERATHRIAADFLRRLIERVPYRIHTVLTDYGFQLTPPRGGWSVGEIQRMLAGRQRFRAHAFDLACSSKTGRSWCPNDALQRTARFVAESFRQDHLRSGWTE